MLSKLFENITKSVEIVFILFFFRSGSQYIISANYIHGKVILFVLDREKRVQTEERGREGVQIKRVRRKEREKGGEWCRVSSTSPNSA